MSVTATTKGRFADAPNGVSQSSSGLSSLA